MQGSWGVAGTDPNTVNNIARSVGDMLEGSQGWMGLLGSALSSLGGRNAPQIEDREDGAEDDRRRRRHRRRRDADYE